jgi:hypothetical protein
MIVLTENDEALLGQRVKWVRDGDFAPQNSGIMNCLPTQVDNALPRSIHSSHRPS